jgi:uncharacterized membrane protein YeaQ/YmgE (transglycosylase-associated protein family)
MLIAIITWLGFGFIVGLIARALVPGDQSLGFVGTACLGVVGSFVGGLIASLIYGYPLFEMRASGFVGSLIGAIIVLAIATSVGSKRTMSP